MVLIGMAQSKQRDDWILGRDVQQPTHFSSIVVAKPAGPQAHRGSLQGHVVKSNGDVDDGTVVLVSNVVTLAVDTGDNEHWRLLDELLAPDGMDHATDHRAVTNDDEFPWLIVVSRWGQPGSFENLRQLFILDRLVAVMAYAVPPCYRIQYHDSPLPALHGRA